MYASILAALIAVIDPSLQPPSDAVLVASTEGGGVQVYACTANAQGGPTWALVEPEASLFDGTGKLFATHGKGPSWTALDGSHIVADGAAPVARVAHAGTIPELLLRVTSSSGSGVLSSIRYVQRLETVGGVAPDAAVCTPAHLGELHAVHYAATYRFFR